MRLVDEIEQAVRRRHLVVSEPLLWALERAVRLTREGKGFTQVLLPVGDRMAACCAVRQWGLEELAHGNE